ncbi:hypothetical protein VHEMI07993 [[Torrubiella] hemipterigena]|uniref:Uncharacterized protein n=1 Tax=[Torrubiella] hemipterigena TaxID=1531966 RepID=A0A0A1TMN8_9HYPO|nr:hypothetical protein VHEMI07993 [[Torrubiella] hemipterigena]
MSGSVWDRIPIEITEQIVSCLFLEDIANLTAASKSFYSLFDPLLYIEDARPFHRHAIYWAAEKACVTVAKKALAGGTPVNDKTLCTPKTGCYGRLSYLHYDRWPEYRNPHTSHDDIIFPKPFKIPEQMPDLVAVLLEAGADMSAVKGAYKDRDLLSFLSTPIGTALGTVNRPFFEVVRQSHCEINEHGAFTPLTLARLAICQGNVPRLEQVLAEDTDLLDLQGRDGKELSEMAYKNNQENMCRLLYRYIHGHEADITYLRDKAGRFRTYNVDIAERAIEGGASCNHMYEADWSELRADLKVVEALRFWWHDHLRPPSLTDVAVKIRDIQLLELAVSYESETLRQPQLGLRKLLGYACAWGELEWVRWILDQGLDLHAQEVKDNYRSPLYAAATAGHIDVVELLLRRGALISGPPSPGSRSLVTEVLLYGEKKESTVPVLEMLLAAGCDISLVIEQLKEGYPEPCGYWIKVKCLPNMCQPGCIELLERYNIMVYRPNTVYLFGACDAANGPLIERLLRDGIMSNEFKEPAESIGLIPPHNEKDREHMKLENVMNRVNVSQAQSAEAVIRIWTMLLAHGADIHNLYCCRSLLTNAIWTYGTDPEGSLLLVNYLLQNGSKVRFEDNVPFLAAIGPPTADFTLHKMLLDAGAVINLATVCTKSENRVRKTVDFLLDYNSAMAKADSIENALLSACAAYNVPVVRTLLRRTSKFPGSLTTMLMSERLDPRMKAFLLSLTKNI